MRLRPSWCNSVTSKKVFTPQDNKNRLLFAWSFIMGQAVIVSFREAIAGVTW